MSEQVSQPLTAENLALHTASLPDEEDAKLSFIIEYVHQQRNFVLRETPYQKPRNALSVFSDEEVPKEQKTERDNPPTSGLWDIVNDRFSPPKKKVAVGMRGKDGSTPEKKKSIRSRKPLLSASPAKHGEPDGRSRSHGPSPSKRLRPNDSENDSEYLPQNFIADQWSRPSRPVENPKPKRPRRVLTESSIESLPPHIERMLQSDSEMEASRKRQVDSRSHLKDAVDNERKPAAKGAPVPGRHSGRTKTANTAAKKAKDESKHATRKQKDKNVKLASKVMENFKAPNIGSNRLSIKPQNLDRPASLGIFNKGRKSEREAVRGTPKIVFNEKRFLEQEENSPNSRQKDANDKQKISAYFQRLDDKKADRRPQTHVPSISNSPIKQSVAVEDAGDGLSKEEVARVARKALEDVMPPLNAKRKGRKITDEEVDGDQDPMFGGKVGRVGKEDDMENIVIDVGEVSRFWKKHPRTSDSPRKKQLQAPAVVDHVDERHTEKNRIAEGHQSEVAEAQKRAVKSTSPKSMADTRQRHPAPSSLSLSNHGSFAEGSPSIKRRRSSAAGHSWTSSEEGRVIEKTIWDAAKNRTERKRASRPAGGVDAKKLWENIANSGTARSTKRSQFRADQNREFNISQQSRLCPGPFGGVSVLLPAASGRTAQAVDGFDTYVEYQEPYASDMPPSADLPFRAQHYDQHDTEIPELYIEPASSYGYDSYDGMAQEERNVPFGMESCQEDPAAYGMNDGIMVDGFGSTFRQEDVSPELPSPFPFLAGFDDMDLDYKLGGLEARTAAERGGFEDEVDYMIDSQGFQFPGAVHASAFGGETQGSGSSSVPFTYKPHRLH
ncbi:hypothetical protein HK097_008094 [Rhizophlyctis rosea]|uniref:Uncharacterized protein n=1 Tax=Rhizophlyctis rosea TaxID=64517 RepID=A0AAD5SAN8_9FUNG|nr:hypothetical protein HK097_008094 [Rhizophlyctis rosea]